MRVKYKGTIPDAGSIEFFEGYAIAKWGPYERIVTEKDFGDYEVVPDDETLITP